MPGQTLTTEFPAPTGPKSIAVIKFPDAQAIKDALSTDDFKALADLRGEAFSRVDQLICTAL